MTTPTNHFRLLLLTFSSLCLVISGSFANDGFFGAIEPARVLHDRGVDGDKQAVIQCIEKLQLMLERSPENHLAKVYLGSAYTLRSRDLFPGPKKLSMLTEGGRLMDEAVAAAPDNIRVRLVRAVNYYKLPAIFGKRELARSELVQLIDMVEELNHDLDPVEVQGIYYFGGLALDDLRQEQAARQLWAAAMELQPDSWIGQRLARKLEN